jgi:hypothetical protein
MSEYLEYHGPERRKRPIITSEDKVYYVSPEVSVYLDVIVAQDLRGDPENNAKRYKDKIIKLDRRKLRRWSGETGVL